MSTTKKLPYIEEVKEIKCFCCGTMQWLNKTIAIGPHDNVSKFKRIICFGCAKKIGDLAK